METLLEDYKRKLKTAEEMLKNKVYNSNEQANRIKIKAGVYRSTIVDIERAMGRQQPTENANCAIFDVSQQRELLAIEGFDKIIKADVNGAAAKIARAYKKSIANCG